MLNEPQFLLGYVNGYLIECVLWFGVYVIALYPSLPIHLISRRIPMFKAQGLASCIFVFLLLGLSLDVANAQDVDTTFQSRTLRQQYFAIDFMKDHPIERHFSTGQEMDAHLDKLQQAWVKEVNDEHPHMAVIDPYVYAWYLYSIVSSTTPGKEPANWAWCRVYTEYMTPAFLTDFDLYSAEITKANAFLVSSGMNWMVSGHMFRCNTSELDWRRLKAAFERTPSLMGQYLEKGIYTNEDVKISLERARNEVEKVRSLFDIKDAIVRLERDLAYTRLAAAFEKEYSAKHIIPLSHALWISYHEAGNSDKAISTLNLLARSVTAGDLSRDTLQAWYAEADPVHGIEEYDKITRDASLPILVASDRHIQLSGTYHDLFEDEPFSLSSLEGKTILFDFWTTWCGPCIGDIPKLKELVEKYEDKFVLISISSDPVSDGADEGAVRDYIEKHEINYRVLYDDEAESLTAKFGVTGWPAKFLISDQGIFMKHPSEKHRASVTLEEVNAYLSTMP